jgi:sugar transferase (PEP-CTERM/EpsH1 system associated)
MKILFVSHRLPYPPHRGGKIRPFNIIRHLSGKHSVVVASLAHTDTELKEGLGLKQYCDDVIFEVCPSSTRWMSSVAYFWSDRLYKRIRERLLKTNFDVIVVHCAFVAQYVADWTGGFRILDFGDVDSAKWSEYSQMRRFPLSVGYKIESMKLRKYELQVARNFNHCSVTSLGELEELERLGVGVPCSLFPNGVDTTYFSPNLATQSAQNVIVFLGRMDYFPNIDGIHYFVREILPIIRRKRPDVKLRIIGSNPVRSVRELSQVPHVSLTGQVADVRPYLTDAAVSVVPLRIARGTQNKILESMAVGIPVVATPQAAKGVQAAVDRDLLVGADPACFAEAVLNLLESRSLRRSVAESARKQIETAHAWASSMKILETIIDQSATKQIPQPA